MAGHVFMTLKTARTRYTMTDRRYRFVALVTGLFYVELLTLVVSDTLTLVRFTLISTGSFTLLALLNPIGFRGRVRHRLRYIAVCTSVLFLLALGVIIWRILGGVLGF